MKKQEFHIVFRHAGSLFPFSPVDEYATTPETNITSAKKMAKEMAAFRGWRVISVIPKI